MPPAHACHKLLVQQNQAYLPGIGVRSVYALSSQPPEDPMGWGTSPEHVRGTEGRTVCAEQGWSPLAAQGSLPFPGTTFTELEISQCPLWDWPPQEAEVDPPSCSPKMKAAFQLTTFPQNHSEWSYAFVVTSLRDVSWVLSGPGIPQELWRPSSLTCHPGDRPGHPAGAATYLVRCRASSHL